MTEDGSTNHKFCNFSLKSRISWANKKVVSRGRKLELENKTTKHRYHLYQARTGLRLPSSNYRLEHQEDIIVEAIQHYGRMECPL